MAALGWLLNLDFAGGTATVIVAVPDVPGLEAAVHDTRLHAAVHDTRLHAAVHDTRLHARLPKES